MRRLAPPQRTNPGLGPALTSSQRRSRLTGSCFWVRAFREVFLARNGQVRSSTSWAVSTSTSSIQRAQKTQSGQHLKGCLLVGFSSTVRDEIADPLLAAHAEVPGPVNGVVPVFGALF